MENLVKIENQILYDAVYEACFKSNIYLPKADFDNLKNIATNNIESNSKMAKIFANASLAAQTQRPLCQDTGQVVIFLEIGKNIVFSETPSVIINQAISDCYVKNSFRKSVVKNALNERLNTQNNTPAIIYTDIVDGDKIKIHLLIKGGGAENMSDTKMLTPSATEEDIIKEITEIVKISGQNACPPLFLGIGIGGTIDYAGVLSKKAFFTNENEELAEKIKQHINSTLDTKVANIKILTAQTHIACLPLCVTINCHSSRHASAIIDKDGYKITTEFATPNEENILQTKLPEIRTTEIAQLKKLKLGSEILLSGTIYTARDMAHKKLVEIIHKKSQLPFELKNAVIFYAGPCPKTENEVIGPIGPTTSKRMDKFAPTLYDNGVLATIGKGSRNNEVKQNISKNKALYFSVQGGVASLLKNCIKSSQIIAFEELGAEAIYKLEIEKLPVKLELK